MDSLLITLVVVAIAALSNWLQHRAQNRDLEGPPSGPQPPRPFPPRARRPVPPATGPRPEREMNLEEALRRLLGGEPPVVPPRPRPIPAGQVLEPTERPRPVAPPVVRPVQPVPAASNVPASPIVRPVEGRVSEADVAYQRVQQLHESVSQRLRDVHQRTQTHASSQPPRGRVAPRIDSTLLALRNNPEAAKRAFIASLIFGSPKGLEPPSIGR